MSDAHWFAYGRASSNPYRIPATQQRLGCRDALLGQQNNGRVPKDLQFGGWFCDHWDCIRTPWLERPRAKALWGLLRPGDIVVVTEWDLSFKNAPDFYETCMRLREAGVELILSKTERWTSLGATEHSISRKFYWLKKQRYYLSHRRKQEFRWIRRRKGELGRLPSAPRGWKSVRVGRKNYRAIPCPHERALGLDVVALRRKGWKWYQIAEMYHRMDIRTKNNTPWGTENLKSLYKATRYGFPLFGYKILQEIEKERQLNRARYKKRKQNLDYLKRKGRTHNFRPGDKEAIEARKAAKLAARAEQSPVPSVHAWKDASLSPSPPSPDPSSESP